MEKTRSAAFFSHLRKRVQSVENPEWKQAIPEGILTAVEYADA